MPFKSKEQERYLQINEPEIYQDWVEKYGRFKGAESFNAENEKRSKYMNEKRSKYMDYIYDMFYTPDSDAYKLREIRYPKLKGQEHQIASQVKNAFDKRQSPFDSVLHNNLKGLSMTRQPFYYHIPYKGKLFVFSYIVSGRGRLKQGYHTYYPPDSQFGEEQICGLETKHGDECYCYRKNYKSESFGAESFSAEKNVGCPRCNEMITHLDTELKYFCPECENQIGSDGFHEGVYMDYDGDDYVIEEQIRQEKDIIDGKRVRAESFGAEAIPIRHSRRLNGYYAIKGYEDASEDGFIYRIYRAPDTNDWFKATVYDDNAIKDNFSKPTSRRLNPSGEMVISNDPPSLLIGAFPKLEDAKRALVFRMIQDGNYHQMMTDGNLKWLLKDYYAESFGAEGDYEPSFDSLEERIEWMEFAVNDKFLHQYEDDYSNVVLDIEEWNENNGNNSKLSNLVKQYKNKTGWMDAESFSAENYYGRNYRGFEINKEGDERQAFYYLTQGDNRIEIEFTKSVEGRRKRGDNYNYASYFYGNYPHTAEKMFETFDEALNWFDEQIDNGRMFKDFKAESFGAETPCAVMVWRDGALTECGWWNEKNEPCVYHPDGKEINAESFAATTGKRMYCPACQTNRTWMTGYKKREMDYTKGERPQDFRFYVCNTCEYAYDPKTSLEIKNWKIKYYGAESFNAEGWHTTRIQNLIDNLYNDREIALNKLLKIKNAKLQKLLSSNKLLKDRVGGLSLAQWAEVQAQLKYTPSGRIRTFGAESFGAEEWWEEYRDELEAVDKSSLDDFEIIIWNDDIVKKHGKAKMMQLIINTIEHSTKLSPQLAKIARKQEEDMGEWGEGMGYDPDAKIGSPYYAESFGAEGYDSALVHLKSLMPINRDSYLRNFRPSELTHSSTNQINFNQASVNYSAENYYGRNYQDFEIYKEGDEQIDDGSKEHSWIELPKPKGYIRPKSAWRKNKHWKCEYCHEIKHTDKVKPNRKGCDVGEIFPDDDWFAESFNSYKVAPDLSSYTKAELVSSIAGPQGTAAYDEVVYDPLAQSRLSAESIDSFSPARLIVLGASIGVALGLYNTRRD